MFQVTVGVLNDQLSETENLRGPYLITLSLFPEGAIQGVLSMYTTNGKATFTDLRILSHNDFTINASSLGLPSTSTPSFYVINFPHSINLTSNIINPTVYSIFSITAKIFGEDNNLYTGECEISLNATSATGADLTSDLKVKHSYKTSTGYASFDIYAIKFGIYNIIGSCQEFENIAQVSKSITIDVKELELVVLLSKIVIFN